MRARDRAEDGDQHDEDGAGRQRVAEQRERDVLRQRLGHDAGADDGGDQQRRAERFGRKAAGQIEGSLGQLADRRAARRRRPCAPISRSFGAERQPVDALRAAG